MTAWREAFALQAGACRALGSPLTARVCEQLAPVLAEGDGALARRVRSWPGDPSHRGDSLPLRLCGALHALVLNGRDPGLARAYAVGDDAWLRQKISESIHQHQLHMLEWVELAPQTNEVARAAVLIAAGRHLASELPGCRFDLLELGASAGLNLNFPLYHLDIADEDQTAGDDATLVRLAPEWRGAIPAHALLATGAARGVDLNPLDPVRDGLRLLSYIWADQHARLERMHAALALARNHPPRVDRGDAGDWLPARLAEPCNHGRLVYHTVAAQYFPAATRARIEAALQAAGAQASPERPLAHLSMEADGGEGAALALRLWAGGGMRQWSLGRADFHARWIDWQPKET
ncbi:DUF2332 domain-containing protein [Paracoccus versutus]|uniref:DUF2332 domain-containing protein n=1 Tax=Paracoccus versutus TaxID=34007 RepID=UPI000DF7A4C3|nr:DUF2332 domain-containing protein [Paracoccus versutus]RDD71572.1 DUF2332 domain-containing protein [Paracoccus versutus]